MNETSLIKIKIFGFKWNRISIQNRLVPDCPLYPRFAVLYWFIIAVLSSAPCCVILLCYVNPVSSLVSLYDSIPNIVHYQYCVARLWESCQLGQNRCTIVTNMPALKKSKFLRSLTKIYFFLQNRGVSNALVDSPTQTLIHFSPRNNKGPWSWWTRLKAARNMRLLTPASCLHLT